MIDSAPIRPQERINGGITSGRHITDAAGVPPDVVGPGAGVRSCAADAGHGAAALKDVIRHDGVG